MASPKAVVVIFVDREGVGEVQVHTSRREQTEGLALYERLRPAVDHLDRIARKSLTSRPGTTSSK